MRTNIELDDALMAEAMKLSGLPTKKATVEAALRHLIRSRLRRDALREMEGLGWEGDLEKSREGRDFGTVR